ncbi:MAG TPA: glycosyl hydrolase family 28-related protein [Armatimonadota bacterium]|jgi:hypothetical protein
MRLYAGLLIAVLGLVSGCAHAAIPEATPQIASLQWEPRSDWLNVRDLGAKGDGVADDTAAIQKAFDLTRDSSDWAACLRNRVVYFPAGKYRITATVTIAESTGAWIVGHGRDTVLLWDGPDNGTMYWSNGATYIRYEGITWDGQGRAAVGVEHSSMYYYETSVRYENCAFLRCKEHGLINGRGKEKVASAEIWFRNCLFFQCGAGASFLNFNDYDNTFDGCDFVDCGIGLNSVNGNFYARACHFVRSTRTDVLQASPSHASSVRLCTSQGSRRFFETGSGMHLSMKIEDCRVDGWTAPDGAITLGHRGPTTIFDCVFTNPPSPAPPIRLANPAGIQALLLVCNNTSPQTAAVVDKGPNSRITEVPKGKRGAVLTSADQSFMMQNAPPAGKIFDVMKDFGAKGDGATDDTDALQAAIDAARMTGKGAVVYLPGGNFNFSRTLRVTGNDYSLGGTGFRTTLNWVGPKDGEMIRVHNPQGITLQHFNMQGDNAVPRIHQTADAGASSIYYDGVYTNGCDEASTITKGLWCENLPKGAVVKIGHFIGNIHLQDCGAARVLCAVHFYSLWIYGATQPKTGIAGFMFHNDACHNYALDVLDNQDVIVADFYSESNKRYLLAEGKDGQGSGRITIGGSKLSPTEDEAITIRNYQGRIFLGGGDCYNQTNWGKALTLVQEGTRPVDFIIAGQAWWAVPPVTKFGPGMRYANVEDLLMENKYPEYAEKSLPNITTPTTQAALIAAFDDFRELAGAYLQDFFVANK